MAETIKNGDIEKAKVSFTCPACGTEFTELPENMTCERIEMSSMTHEIFVFGYAFETKCPTCGLLLRKVKNFGVAAPEVPGT